jgi:long-chain acyl-CoA synthetase
MLTQHAIHHPDRPAVVFDDQVLSFAELDRRSTRLAQALITLGLRPGDRVILYVGNSLDLVEAIAAVWKAGGLIVPITPWMVGRELAFMVGDCQPFAILYGPQQREHVERALSNHQEVRPILIGEKADGPVVTLASLCAAGSDTPLPPLPVEADDAVIGYTSGTTGTPKGAVLTHTNLILNQLNTAVFWALSVRDVYLVTTPLAHRVGLSRLVACFCLGATLVVMPRFNAAEATDLLWRHRVTVLGTVPTVCRLLLEEMEKTDNPFASLRLITATGEAFPIALKKRLAARLPHVQLISCYASTEGGVITALMPHEQQRKPASVGRPMPGMEVRIVDAQGHDVPPGEAGEVWIRSGVPGHGLIAREYYRRPAATAEAFTAGWFHTGDVGRFDTDGYLYLVDRIKDMILSGGLNIYSREVEQAIEALPGVQEVAVVAGPDDAFGECVVAYVVRRPGAAVTAEDILEHCRTQIASYKKPKHIFFVDQLPRNAHGKILKTALRQHAAVDISGSA